MHWSSVDFCDVFISCLDSHSDGTHSLHRIHWWTSDVVLNFSKSVPMRKQTDLHLGWPESEYILSDFLCVNMKCIHVIGVGFVPLSGDGVCSALHLFPSAWAAAAASGVGLVLQLFSIFTGEESAIELWLLFSSIRETTACHLRVSTRMTFKSWRG